MNTDTSGKRAAALEFLKKNDAGVLATASPDGTPHARTIYYTVDDNFCIYFMTLSDTRKVEELIANDRAAFVVSAPEVPATVQIEGTVTDESLTASADENVKRLFEAFFKKGDNFAPLNHMDQTNVSYFKLTPSWIRWGDFTTGENTDDVLIEVSASA